MKLKVIVHKEKSGGYWAEVPSLPGCVTQGETLDELRANVREAIAGWLAVDKPKRPAKRGTRVIEIAV
jgi:predicted RNase H-like HicB family nuclease